MKYSRLLPLLAVLFVVACGEDDPVEPPRKGNHDATLATKANVLAAFEAAFNSRNIAAYERLLDQNFTFVLATSDVIGHGLPEKFDRTEEIYVTSRLLNKQLQGDLRCSNLKVDIKFPPRFITWLKFSPDEAPDETWYMTTLYNEYRFEIGPDIYLSKTGARVQLTVRNVSTESEPSWRLVEWRELEADESLTGAARVATDTRTWGEIKSLYVP